MHPPSVQRLSLSQESSGQQACPLCPQALQMPPSQKLSFGLQLRFSRPWLQQGSPISPQVAQAPSKQTEL
jgi:hypothetical protein